MSGTQPVMLYGLKVPPGDILVAGAQELPAMFHVTMAAIDPTEEPEEEADSNGAKHLRSTLKIVRMGGLVDQFSSDTEDEDGDETDLLEDEEDEESSDEEETNGGPSDPEKVKKAQEASAMKSSSEEEESDDEDGPIDIEAALKRIAKGKAPATDDDDDDSEDEDIEMEEFVVCTLDPEKQYQQPLDIVCNEHENLFFKVTGTHAIYLTGNYVTALPDRDESYQPAELEDEYDLSPDEDELDLLEEDDEDESDELDDLEDPRITEVDSDDEMDEAPKLIEQAKGKAKGKNKRPAEDSESEEAETLDDLIAKTVKPEEPLTNGSAKLSKKERKKLKKLNNGVAAPVVPAKDETKDSPVKSEKSDKKVQFAEKLEQGPTNSKKKGEDKKADKKADEKADKKAGEKVGKKADKKITEPKSTGQEKAKPSVKVVHGVTIDDRKIGAGPGAKKGDRLEMRYIGKLENGKTFDANKGGKPFGLKLGAGEVIKGWDIGLVGMAIGGERRLTIPPNQAYGSKSEPGIPSNSTLVFDVKLLNIK